KLGVPDGIAESLHNLGMTYSSLGQEIQAIEYYTRALEIRLKLGAQAEIANNLNNLAHLHYRLHQYEKALEYCLRALEIREQVGNRRDIAQTLYNLGKIYMSLGRLEEAQAAFDRALQLFETVGEQVADPTQIGAFQEAHQGELYPRYALLLTLRNRLPEALAIADRGRARGLALQAAQTRADITRFSPEDARLWQAGIEELTRSDRLLHAAQQRLEQAISQEKTGALSQRDKARERYETAERHLTVLRTKLYQRYPSFRRLSGAEPLAPAQLKELARRNPDTLYLHFDIVDNETTLLFTLSHRDGLRRFLLPGRKQLIRRAQEWRATLTAPAALQSPETPLTQKQELMRLAKAEPQHARALFRELLQPLEKDGLLKPGRYQRLVIVPDGPLHTIPFAALMDGGGKRLIDRFAISTSISLGLLIWPIHHKQPANGLFVVTDPTGGEGERFVKHAGVTRGPALMGNFTPGPLRYARDGAKQVAQMFPDVLGLAGPQAREAMVKQQMGRYALLLFATHGVLDPANGLRSWLLMAKEPQDSAEDGRLEASEIINTPLSAQLAVLMACESGLGRHLGGDMQGLVWAFWAAGCPSVIASQWKVDEVPTKQLMVVFYRSLKAGQRKDSAWRHAMREVRKDARYAHPFYWAAFQVYGNTLRCSMLSTSSNH
ncbi:MAG TPA: CHAT domain-containing tetratricopeptide repeat protein, partial [Chthonomonadales bacterium]|nr:CHAT domain-containing tetratricopeptide repeat protein [Chthonomonadales bacterium]